MVGTGVMRSVASQRAASHGAASSGAARDEDGTKDRANDSTKDGADDGATVDRPRPFPTSLTTVK